MIKPYRPRLPEVIAMLDAMPGTDRDLQPHGGHDLKWTQQKLSALLKRRVITRRNDVYSRVGEVKPSYTLQVLDAMRAGAMTRKAIKAIGVNGKSLCFMLTTLERRGLIECDSTVRPFRYRLPSREHSAGLEALAAYKAKRYAL